MAKRKSKTGGKQEDGSYLIESSHQSGGASYVLPGLLFLIIAIGGSTLGIFCMQQQSTLDQLSESFTMMQKRISNFQNAMGMTDAQAHSELQVEERILALEEAQKDAQQKAEVALETSESLKNSDLHAQIWALHSEMDAQLAEMQQVAVSTAALHALLKNKSEEFDAVKESVANILGSNSVLAASVAGLNSAVGSTNSRLNEQVTVMDTLHAQLEGHASELSDMKVALDLHKVALYANNQDVVMIKQLVEAEQAMRALMLEKKLTSVEKTLDEQLITSQSLHTNLKAQLKNVHNQLLKEGQHSPESADVESDVEVPPAVEEPEVVPSPTEEVKEEEVEKEEEEVVKEEEVKEEEKIEEVAEIVAVEEVAEIVAVEEVAEIAAVVEKDLEHATEVPEESDILEEVMESPEPKAEKVEEEAKQEEESVEQDVEHNDLPETTAEEEVTGESAEGQEVEESWEDEDDLEFAELSIAE